MTFRVGSKGQVVIDKRIRDELGVEPGSLAIQQRVGDHVEIAFLPPEHTRSLRGILQGARRRTVPIASWEKAKSDAWRAAAVIEEGGPSEGADNG
ncbi:MAG TPA: AbrB/MazE/SpoVT family DNA-binding domain-containing protein [Thermoanaerobaculia bacterium]|nr:AbrB/MazE/SpoVT family DNA-binding domain-containing protein [Thermoanaerobaculia bacterium]